MSRLKTVAPQKYDDAKLAEMVEPLTVRIEKIKGTTRTPIPMPESESALPGQGLMKDDVRGLEQWLVSDWSGGGLYEITVTDSSVPPLQLKWSPYFNPADFPERVPPPLTGGLSQAAQAAQTASQVVPFPMMQPQPQIRTMPAFPNGFPQSPFVPQQPQQAWPWQQAPSYYQMPAPPPMGTVGYQQWQTEADRRRHEDEVRTLREQNAQREREALAEKHRAELERERVANESRFSRQESQMAELRNMFTALAETIKNGATSPKSDPQVELLREQNRQLEAQRERDAREREAERREVATRESIKAMQEANQRQFEAMQRQFEAVQTRLSEANQNRQDPLISMLQEQARQHADAIKEIARNQAASLDRIQGFMMNPRDMFMMAKENSATVDQATERISRAFNSVLDVQQKVTENLLQMQPQGSGALDVVREGLTGVKELAERYVGQKATNERIAMQAQAQIAEAQARAYAAAHGQPTPEPIAAAPAGQLSGAPTNGVAAGAATAANGTKPKKAKKTEGKSPTVAAKAGPSGETQVAQTSSAKVKRLGKTDAEWFGPLISNVEELRGEVDKYLDALRQDPPAVNDKGELPGVGPEQAAMVVIQAVGLVMQQNIIIPAMTDLLFQDRFADFIDVLIPDATQPYRDDTTQALIELAKKVTGAAEPEDAEDEADEEDETNEAEAG